MTSTFDYNKHLSNFNLIVSIATQLAGKTELAAVCIKLAIQGNMSNVAIISTLKDMITDNEHAMFGLLGEELTAKIKNHVL